MPRPSVLIVGAGPTGLVLALWLTKLGVAVRIVDKLPQPAPFSRALGVQARTLEFYRQIGVADAIVAHGVRVRGVNLWVRGARAARLPFENIGEGLTPFPFVLDCAQDQHERLLIEQLEGLSVRVDRETECRRVEQAGDGVRATLVGANGAEESLDVAYVAGCDGAHSTVREQLGVQFPGATYDELFYVADVDATGPASNGELHVDLDQADLLAVFPMPGERHVRLVGTVRASERDGRELTFADVRSRAVEQLNLEIGTVNWFSPYHVHHRVAQSFSKGRVFLLGDAAHIHSPVGAQGMNTGIGDAVNLAWKLADVIQGRASERLLESYETERLAFAQRLVATTDRIFTFATKCGAVAERVRTRLMPMLAPRLLQRGAVRRFLFRTVSQLAVNYRASPLSEGRAGTVWGGDRLPWVRTGATSDNFAPLSSLSWQVHCYGQPTTGLAETCDELGFPFHTFAWSDSMQHAGLLARAAYLIRPDGYVAFADPTGDPARLLAYVAVRRERHSWREWAT